MCEIVIIEFELKRKFTIHPSNDIKEIVNKERTPQTADQTYYSVTIACRYSGPVETKDFPLHTLLFVIVYFDFHHNRTNLYQNSGITVFTYS